MAIAVRDLRAARPERSIDAGRDFDDFYRAYSRRVRGLVRRRISDRELAAEVVQDTFLRAYAHFDRFDMSRSAWPWLATVAGNLCIDALRRAAREAAMTAATDPDVVTEVDFQGLDWKADPAEAFEQSLRADAVRAALAAVPARQRQVLLLKDDEGWTTEAIADLDGGTTEGIKSLVRRARVTFRQSYERVADQKGIRAGFGVLGAPLARLRGRLSQAAVTRAPLLGGHFLGFPIDASQVFGAAMLSGLMFVGAVPATIIVTAEPVVSTSPAPVAVVDGPGAVETDSGTDEKARRTAVSVSAPAAVPASSTANATLTEDGDARTLDGIIAGKTGGTRLNAPFDARFRCDATETRRAACDTAEQLPSL